MLRNKACSCSGARAGAAGSSAVPGAGMVTGPELGAWRLQAGGLELPGHGRQQGPQLLDQHRPGQAHPKRLLLGFQHLLVDGLADGAREHGRTADGRVLAAAVLGQHEAGQALQLAQLPFELEVGQLHDAGDLDVLLGLGFVDQGQLVDVEAAQCRSRAAATEGAGFSPLEAVQQMAGQAFADVHAQRLDGAQQAGELLAVQRAEAGCRRVAHGLQHGLHPGRGESRGLRLQKSDVTVELRMDIHGRGRAPLSPDSSRPALLPGFRARFFSRRA
jgi:hypothetical protein